MPSEVAVINDETAVEIAGYGSLSPGSSVVEQSNALIDWFRPASQQDVDDSNGILKSAYEKAIAFHRDQYKGRRKDDLAKLFESSSVEDVLAHIQRTEQQHVGMKEGRSRLSAAVNSGWTTMVSKINTFSSVIDVLVSTHPEYAAPVWGTIKFMFMVTLSHQELSSKVVEAFSAISGSLPELNFLAKQLYPVSRIQQTLASMYTHIIDFCIRALKWYQKASGGVFKRALAAMKNPWPLEFEDVVHQIKQANTRIREQADIAHKAETRHISLTMSDVQLEVRNLRKDNTDIKTLMVSGLAHPAFGKTSLAAGPVPLLLPQPTSVLPSTPFLPEKMSKYFLSIPFDPEKALANGRAMRNLERARGSSNWDDMWSSTKLRDWISQAGSAVVELQGLIAAPDASRHFAFDTIDLVKSTDLPLTWYVSSRVPSTSSKEPITATDIVRSLVQQLLSQNRDAFTNSNLTESEFASCSTEENWLHLLVAVLIEIPRVVVILDSHSVGRQILDAVRKFWRIIDERKKTTTIKMLLMTYPSPGELMPAILPNDDMASAFTLVLGPSRYPGSLMHGNARDQRRTLPRQGSGPSQLKPFILQLVESKGKSEDGS
ncbi:hypothetical protein EDB81DRAFT_885529 [Dactylonectria macrodidyma]|uniref:DUF7708 domain-containing protein n=1 Tax=Dactylonectria macrodidyma TaxID=307937 RepID=A0A9P9EMG3_9HYPO|nr:hypothetical protein EDB81DRAFT_885529 [Dactylonectria macrodidyma]